MRSAPIVTDDIHLQSRSPVSGLHAVFEDDGTTAYLYLTGPDGAIMRDAVAYTRRPLPETVDWEWIRKNREAPPLFAAIASASAVIGAPEAAEFSFQWSADGESVALLRHGQPLALCTIGERYGLSKAVSVANPIAHPWSEERFRVLFGQ